MTSEEMTTGSIPAGENERKALAARSRWWNSTGSGTCTDRTYNDLDDTSADWKSYVDARGKINGGPSNVVKTGDGGERFRLEFPEVDLENWRWMRERKVNVKTGIALLPEPLASDTATKGSITQQQQQSQQSQQQQQQNRQPIQPHIEGNAARRRHGIAGAGPTASTATGTAGAVVKGGESWLRRHKFLCAMVLLCGYVLLARLYE